jgi:hypothetical protein
MSQHVCSKLLQLLISDPSHRCVYFIHSQMLSTGMARDASAQPLLRNLADEGDHKSTLKKPETFSIGDRNNSFSTTSKRRSNITGIRAWCRRFGKTRTASATRVHQLVQALTDSVHADCAHCTALPQQCVLCAGRRSDDSSSSSSTSRSSAAIQGSLLKRVWEVLGAFFTKKNPSHVKALLMAGIMCVLLLMESGILVAFSYSQRHFSTALTSKVCSSALYHHAMQQHLHTRVWYFLTDSNLACIN